MTTPNAKVSKNQTTVWKDYFNQKKDARQWLISAENLWQAADVLFDAYLASTAEDGEPIRPENTELNIPATLLYGYALENAIKGLLIKKLNLDSSNLSAYEKCPQWMQHDLVALLNDTGISANENEKRILKTLTCHVLWAGKYPHSKKNDGFILPNQYEHDSLEPVKNLPPISINATMRKKIKRLFDMMLSEIQKDLLPKLKPSA